MVKCCQFFFCSPHKPGALHLCLGATQKSAQPKYQKQDFHFHILTVWQCSQASPKTNVLSTLKHCFKQSYTETEKCVKGLRFLIPELILITIFFNTSSVFIIRLLCTKKNKKKNCDCNPTSLDACNGGDNLRLNEF